MAESKIAIKIAALFAKARAEGATPAESEAFAAKAHELMMQYAVEEAEVIAAGGAPNEIMSQQAYLLEKLGPQNMRSLSLANVLAKANGLYMFYEDSVYVEKFDARVTVIHFTGKKVALDGCIALWGALQNDMHSQATGISAYYGHPDWDDNMSKAANTKNMRASFLDGFILAIATRLKEMQVKVEEESGMSLHPVLVDDAKRARQKLNDEGFRFSTGRTSKPGRAGSSRQAGREAGGRANLAKTSIQTRKAIGSK
jgi:hypothetical protein